MDPVLSNLITDATEAFCHFDDMDRLAQQVDAWSPYQTQFAFSRPEVTDAVLTRLAVVTQSPQPWPCLRRYDPDDRPKDPLPFIAADLARVDHGGERLFDLAIAYPDAKGTAAAMRTILDHQALTPERQSPFARSLARGAVLRQGDADYDKLIALSREIGESDRLSSGAKVAYADALASRVEHVVEGDPASGRLDGMPSARWWCCARWRRSDRVRWMRRSR